MLLWHGRWHISVQIADDWQRLVRGRPSYGNPPMGYCYTDAYIGICRCAHADLHAPSPTTRRDAVAACPHRHAGAGSPYRHPGAASTYRYPGAASTCRYPGATSAH
jgi:hypothetical protein